MKTKSLQFPLLGLLTCITGLGPVIRAANIEISGAQKEIFGTSTDVPGSGTPANFDSSTVDDDFAVFDMQKIDGGTTTDYADLVVTYLGGSDPESQVMIAQTSNSQGLTDTGTLSILMEASSGGSGANFRFEWYAPGSYSGGSQQSSASLLSDPILYTTFDIDFSQFVSIDKDVLQHYVLDESTVITPVDDGNTISFEDDGEDSTFDDPTTAAQFLTTADTASHEISMGKQSSSGPGLFLFEFRDPSDVLGGNFDEDNLVVVPEIASIMYAVILLAAAGGLGFFRRHSHRKS